MPGNAELREDGKAGHGAVGRSGQESKVKMGICALAAGRPAICTRAMRLETVRVYAPGAVPVAAGIPQAVLQSLVGRVPETIRGRG